MRGIAGQARGALFAEAAEQEAYRSVLSSPNRVATTVTDTSSCISSSTEVPKMMLASGETIELITLATSFTSCRERSAPPDTVKTTAPACEHRSSDGSLKGKSHVRVWIIRWEGRQI